MPKLRVSAFGVSIDGFGAGPDQSLGDPLGVGGMGLHNWFFPTRTFQKMHGGGDGTTGVDDDFAAQAMADIGAWILGRNMFGPVRSPWPDENWKGWWGDEPPYHTPVFVLTHHPRPPLTMQGGTTFHFVTGGIHEACSARSKRRRARTSEWAAGRPRFGNTFEPASSTRCTLPSLRCCSAPGKRCSRASRCSRWATDARSTLRRRMHSTSF